MTVQNECKRKVDNAGHKDPFCVANLRCSEFITLTVGATIVTGHGCSISQSSLRSAFELLKLR